MPFASRLTAAMDAAGLSVPALAAALDDVVDARTIRRWRNGQSAPGIEALPILARALDTTPNHLVGWEA